MFTIELQRQRGHNTIEGSQQRRSVHDSFSRNRSFVSKKRMLSRCIIERSTTPGPFIRPLPLSQIGAGIERAPPLRARTKTMPRGNDNFTDAYLVIDDDAFDVCFKLQEQYIDRRLCFIRNAS